MAETRVPLFIDAYANHDSSALRSLVWGVTAGREGVFHADHLRVTALTTPGPQIRIAPGVFAVLNRAIGGSFECYLDKFAEELVRDVEPTDATVGGRTDLVVARIKNPYPGGQGTAGGGGNWPEPADRADGPYWDVDILRGLAPNINSPQNVQATMTAIPLARITRPPNTGIVLPGHLTELRSLVDVSGERIIWHIVENEPEPPVEPPPIAQQMWTNSREFPAYSELDDDVDWWKDWPAGAWWDVPIPSWAVEVDIMGSFNPHFDNDIWGETRLNFGGNGGPHTTWDENVGYSQSRPGPQKVNIPLAGTYQIPANQRGRVVRMTLQNRHLDPSTHSGDLATKHGVYLTVFLNFKRYPY